MRLLIWHKLFIAMLAATTTVVVMTLLLTRWSFNRGFLDYINTIETQRIESIASDLAGIYGETNSWDALLSGRGQWRNIMARYSSGARPPVKPSNGNSRELRRPSPPPSAGRDRDRRSGIGKGINAGRRDPKRERNPREGRPPFSPPPPPAGPLGVSQPIDLLDMNQNVLIGRPDSHNSALLKPIELDGITVGYLRYLPVSALTDLDEKAEQQFIEQQRAGLYGTALTAFFIAAMLAFLLGRRLVAPIRNLVSGTQALSAGNLEQRINVTSHDELGALAEDFNSMAAKLEQSRRTQQQWIVDISHELRTPLAILTGELQALEDGIRDWTPGTRESLQAEIDRLTALVGDLREVSRSDAGGMDYHWRDVDMITVIENALESYAMRIADCGLSVETVLSANAVPLRGDGRRLEQLVINLLENACRYTDTGGMIRITCSADDKVHLTIEDTAPGVPAEALPRLFDRLYRIEQSRNRGYGGSGLGLAICKGIVAAHGGQIRVAPSPLGGLAVEIELPHDHT